MSTLIIGSRGSKLALWQSNWVKQELERLHPGLKVQIEIIKTTGDKLSEASLIKIGGKGVFTKELEEALLSGAVDLAVHSLKDLPTILPDGLHLAAITEREDVRDALIVRKGLRRTVRSVRNLPEGARVGTSSLRRRAQLKAARPDLTIIELRGNVDTRLRKVDEGDYDAIILAAAGIIRLGYGDRITARLEPDEMLPAVGQAALGIETRIKDPRVNKLLEPLNHWPTRYATEAERAALRELGGGCAVPIAAYGRVHKEYQLILEAIVADSDGRRVLKHQCKGPIDRADDLGRKLAKDLIEAGALKLLPRLGDSPEPSHPEPSHPTPPVEPPPVLAPVPSVPIDRSKLSAVLKNRAQVETPHMPIPLPPPERAVTAKPLVPSKAPVASPPPVVSPPSTARTTPVVSSPPVAPTTPVVSSPPVASTTPVVSSPPVAHTTQVAATPPAAPLRGKRIIITRAIKQAGSINQALDLLGAELIICPTIEIKPPASWEALDRALIHLSWYDWIVFTSANGVEYFLRRLEELGHKRSELESHRICAIGPVTAQKLLYENLSVDLTPETFTAEALSEAFIKTYGPRQRLRGACMLLPTSNLSRNVIGTAMQEIGVYVETVEAYQTARPAVPAAELSALIRNVRADYIIFTSPSTVDNLGALVEPNPLSDLLGNTRVVCIGPVTANAAASLGLEIHIQPTEHTGKAIVEAIVADCLQSSGKQEARSA
jgi:hydroxymethylbilane synthase